MKTQHIKNSKAVLGEFYTSKGVYQERGNVSYQYTKLPPQEPIGKEEKKGLKAEGRKKQRQQQKPEKLKTGKWERNE